MKNTLSKRLLLCEKSINFLDEKVASLHRVNNALTIYLILGFSGIYFINKGQIVSEFVIDVIFVGMMLLYLTLEYVKNNYYFSGNKEYLNSLSGWCFLRGKTEVLVELEAVGDTQLIMDKQFGLLAEQAAYFSTIAMENKFIVT
jgi:hypothetical protein